MTDDERAVASALKKLSKARRRAEKRLSNAREVLGDNCTHPKKFVEEYRWEHDNGYGRQTMITGLRCRLCMKSKRWMSSSIWS